MTTQMLRLYLIILTLLFAGCSGNSSSPETAAPSAVRMAPMEKGDAAEGGTAGSLTSAPEDPSPPQRERKIIRNAFVELATSDVRQSVQTVSALTADFHGYVDNSSFSEYRDNPTASLSLRVPADSLDRFLAELKSIGELRSQNVSAEDQTQQYYDLDLRLRNKQATLEKLLELRKQAHSLSDIIEVEKQIEETQTQIESLKTQFKYLSEQIDYSHVNVTLSADRSGFFHSIVQGIKDGFNGIGEVLQFVIIVSIAGIPAFVLLYFVIVIFRRLLRRSDEKRAGKERVGS